MKTTIDIPDEELSEAMKHSGAKTKREAVVAAISEYNRRRRLEKIAARFGKSKTFMTQDELRRVRADDREV
jgi:Arc/MetJ family transcription regulator